MKEFTSMRTLINDSSWKEKVINYVVSRQNPDGGFTFVEDNDSNAQDTYYGLAILKSLDSSFPKMEKTVEWLREFKVGAIYSYYYVGRALSLCGEHLDDRFQKYVAQTIASKRYFGSVDVYIEVASEFRATHMVLELVSLLGISPPANDVVNWLLKYKNGNGGFGAHKHSNINSTYYAMASLDMMGFDMESLQGTKAFLRTCEKRYGGFTVVPHNLAPYMEYTYYGVMALDALEENCRFPSQTVEFVLSCQNANGGFARTDLGISTFENTFEAIKVLQKLTSM
jgi:hypothetical protein